MNPNKLPVTPNSPVLCNGKQMEGEFQLKKFGNIGFIQNVKYEPALIKYDKNYQNDREKSGSILKKGRSILAFLSKFTEVKSIANPE